MSGIAGLVDFRGAPVEPGLAEKMTAAMAGRGPDGIAHWRRGAAALGHCMLRTTPEAMDERQPLVNEDGGVVLVLDGRVDNGAQLRLALEGCGRALRDRSDAELVLRAYQAWGAECADRIIGEFAFFVWDEARRELFGARDAAGTRNVYYAVVQGRFAFASEIGALLALGAERRLNESRLLDYLVTEYDRDDQVETFYQGIARLPAGHVLRATARGTEVRRYWDPANVPPARFASMDECAEAFLAELRVATRSRLRSNGPVGAMLSGGLDSSSVVALIRAELRAELAQPLRTFSLVREDRGRCADARGIASMLEGGWIEPTILDPAAVESEAYIEAIAAMDEPWTAIQGYNDALIYDEARRQGCRVMLEGMAGDLLFYSFDRSLDFRRDTLRRLPAVVAAHRRHSVPIRAARVARKLAAAVAPEAARALYRRMRDREPPRGRAGLLHRSLAAPFLAAKRAQRERSRPRRGDDRAEHARNFTSGLLSFAHEVSGQVALSRGVEPRSPFSDRRVIELAVSMPVEAKLSASWYKPLLRRSMRGILPDEVRWRREVGWHPGGDFQRRLIEQMEAGAPRFWNRQTLERKLGRWIDPTLLQAAWNDPRGRSVEGGVGSDLLACAILARWLDARFDGVSLD